MKFKSELKDTDTRIVPEQSTTNETLPDRSTAQLVERERLSVTDGKGLFARAADDVPVLL